MGLNCQKAICNDTVTAWFTVDIPIPDGPQTFGGLPGLIMKLDDKSEQYECIAIEKTSENVPDRPKRGKRMTMAEFKAFLHEDFSHMGERLGYE